MGANLYIESLYHYDSERHTFVGSEAEGYFRDSYNPTSLLRALGLSWWTDVTEMLDEEGNLPVEEIQKLKDMVIARELVERAETTQREENALFAMLAAFANTQQDMNIIPTPDKSLKWTDEERQYFIKKKERFVAFLDRAIALNEPIECSL